MIHKKVTNQCGICDKSFAGTQTLNMHMKSVHVKIKFQCYICALKTARFVDLELHLRNVHKENLKVRLPELTNALKHQCDVCHKSFPNERYLRLHNMRVHEGKGQPDDCNICGKSFTSGGKKSRHIKSVHEKIKRFQCGTCKKCFVSKSTLKVHVEAVHEKIKYDCHICKRSISRLKDLNSCHHKYFHPDTRGTRCICLF